MYQRITKDVWMIMGRWAGEFDVVEEWGTHLKAKDRIRILRLLRPGWSLWVKVKRVKI